MKRSKKLILCFAVVLAFVQTFIFVDRNVKFAQTRAAAKFPDGTTPSKYKVVWASGNRRYSIESYNDQFCYYYDYANRRFEGPLASYSTDHDRIYLSCYNTNNVLSEVNNGALAEYHSGIRLYFEVDRKTGKIKFYHDRKSLEDIPDEEKIHYQDNCARPDEHFPPLYVPENVQ